MTWIPAAPPFVYANKKPEGLPELANDGGYIALCRLVKRASVEESYATLYNFALGIIAMRAGAVKLRRQSTKSMDDLMTDMANTASNDLVAQIARKGDLVDLGYSYATALYHEIPEQSLHIQINGVKKATFKRALQPTTKSVQRADNLHVAAAAKNVNLVGSPHDCIITVPIYGDRAIRDSVVMKGYRWDESPLLIETELLRKNKHALWSSIDQIASDALKAEHRAELEKEMLVDVGSFAVQYWRLLSDKWRTDTREMRQEILAVIAKMREEKGMNEDL